MVYVAVVLVVVVVLAAVLSIRILKQYERGVQFRLGRVKDGARGPGLIFIARPVTHRPRARRLRFVEHPG